MRSCVEGIIVSRRLNEPQLEAMGEIILMWQVDMIAWKVFAYLWEYFWFLRERSRSSTEDNKMKELNSRAFDGSANLEMIDLSGNRFIDKNFDSPEALTTLQQRISGRCSFIYLPEPKKPGTSYDDKFEEIKKLFEMLRTDVTNQISIITSKIAAIKGSVKDQGSRK